MKNAYTFGVDQVLDMDLTELRQVLSRPGGRSISSVVRSVALFIGYLVLAVPVGAAFLIMVIFLLPIWAFTKDEIAAT